MTQANNCGVFIGRVGKDPESRQAGQNTVAKFSLAVDRGRKDRDGQKITDWLNVELWGKQAELAMEMIRKGTMLSVCGAVNIDEWTDQHGARQKMVKIAADNFQLLSPKDAATAGNYYPPGTSPADELATQQRAQEAGRWQHADPDEIPAF